MDSPPMAFVQADPVRVTWQGAGRRGGVRAPRC